MPMLLANPEEKSDLIRWNVPFANGRWPSVGVITDPDNSNVIVVIRPKGFGSFPQYLLRFYDVVTLLCYEETCAMKRDWDELVFSERNLCAYRWISSPWLKHYRILEQIQFTKSNEKLHHYILLGADTMFEAIALGEPEIERVDQRMAIEMKFEIT